MNLMNNLFCEGRCWFHDNEQILVDSYGHRQKNRLALMAQTVTSKLDRRMVVAIFGVRL